MQRTFGLKGVNKMSNIISYNSWENKAPFGAIKINQGVRISVQVNEGYDLLNLKWVILKEDKIVGEVDLIRESKKYYQGEFNGFNETGLYFYYFEVDINIYSFFGFLFLFTYEKSGNKSFNNSAVSAAFSSSFRF